MSFQNAANKFLHWRVRIMHGTVLETNQVVQDSRDSITKLHSQVDDAKKGIHETGQGLMRRFNGLESQVVNGLQKILGDQTKNAKCE